MRGNSSSKNQRPGPAKAIVFAAMLLSPLLLSAQMRDPNPGRALYISGHADLDLAFNSSAISTAMPEGAVQRETKNPFTAGMMSAVVPGLGQFYAKEPLRGSLYLLAELGLWAAFIVYSDQADKQDDEFRNYADANYSVVRYVEWIGRRIGADTSGVIRWNSAGTPWDKVDWEKLNQLERHVATLGTNGFTHTLPQRPEQQYYELIGKYTQYISGWADNPDPTLSDILRGNTSPQFQEYRSMRGRANELYRAATLATTVILVNHIVSALDAAWTTANLNQRLRLEARMLTVQRTKEWVELIPTAYLQITF